MTTETTITRTPADKTTGITVDELGAFLQEVHRAGIDGGARTKVEAKG